MQILVYEAVSAGALPNSLSGSLRAEGLAMLSALLEDFGRIPQVKMVTSLLARSVSEGKQISRLRFGLQKHDFMEVHGAEEPHIFRRLASQADFTLVVAPECAGLLHQRCRWVEEEGGRLLGPTSQAVRLTADKLELANFLRDRGIPTPPCAIAETAAPVSFPAVMKPRDGAGSQSTVLVQNSADIEEAVASARSEGWTGELLLQPYMAGQSCSVSFLIGKRCFEALLPASQDFSDDDGSFHYRGGSIPLPGPLADRATRLSTRAVQAVPGLHGYVGVDLILGSAEDGSQDYVIEINPRLTTSYVGLRQLAIGNLAEAMIQAACQEKISPLQWKKGRVRFWPDGSFEQGPFNAATMEPVVY
ncbi:MAG: ATP-grasp domain-containing protein [Gemmataceae bacterium]